ncbi:hypothetical protein DR71_1374 [Corynebacterium sp. ATCC 6931]|nr:hypothetical protein DR71_1374 [Corynebacterium sp. ATCC 6931]
MRLRATFCVPRVSGPLLLSPALVLGFEEVFR